MKHLQCQLTGFTIGANTTTVSHSTTVTIIDDDGVVEPVASISSAYSAFKSYGLNNEYEGLSVTLSQASTNTVKVGYTFADGTATKGTDYRGTDGMLIFTPDQSTGLTPTTLPIPFEIISNSATIGETFTITLSIPAGGNATVNEGR